MEGSSFRRPTVAASPRRRSRSPAPRRVDPLDAGEDYGSEAASRFEPAPRGSYVPVAYPVAEVAPAEGGGAAIPSAVPYLEEEEARCVCVCVCVCVCHEGRCAVVTMGVCGVSA